MVLLVWCVECAVTSSNNLSVVLSGTGALLGGLEAEGTLLSRNMESLFKRINLVAFQHSHRSNQQQLRQHRLTCWQFFGAPVSS